jgi:hypothetical protein
MIRLGHFTDPRIPEKGVSGNFRALTQFQNPHWIKILTWYRIRDIDYKFRPVMDMRIKCEYQKK